MAFKARNLMTIPGGGNTALVVVADDAPINTMKNPGYWSTTLTGEDADARAYLEAFVKRYGLWTTALRNAGAESGVVPFLLIGNNGMDMDNGHIFTGGRIFITGGVWSLKA